MLDHTVFARRIVSHGFEATTGHARIGLVHRGSRENPAILNTLAGATEVRGTIRRKD